MNIEKLPEMCYTILKSKNEIVLIKRGVSGFFPQREENAKWELENLDCLNESLGVTKAQEKAMEMGSMFGWDTPSANPDNYDVNGHWIKK